MKINLNIDPHHNCPSFDRCNVNKCPLHRNFYHLKDEPEDKLIKGWRKCRAGKPIRMRIAKAFNLKNKGLSVRELARYRRSREMKKELELHGIITSKRVKQLTLRGLNQ